MKPLYITLDYGGKSRKKEAIGLRTAAIIMKLLDDAGLIESWPTGRGELHWKNEKVALHLTRVDSG